MSLRLLLDEDSQAKYLINLLHVAGHDVVTVKEVNLGGRPDSVILNHARQELRVLLTRNCEDFQALHLASSVHPGILAIYQEPGFSRNMSYQTIVKAISNLEVANYKLDNQFVILNQWNY